MGQVRLHRTAQRYELELLTIAVCIITQRLCGLGRPIHIAINKEFTLEKKNSIQQNRPNSLNIEYTKQVIPVIQVDLYV